MAKLFHVNTYSNFAEVRFLFGLVIFLFKCLTRASIVTIKPNLTSLNHFFLCLGVQANKSYVITHYLFTWTTFHKSCLYEVKLCLNVLIGAQGKRLIKKSSNQAKFQPLQN